MQLRAQQSALIDHWFLSILCLLLSLTVAPPAEKVEWLIMFVLYDWDVDIWDIFYGSSMEVRNDNIWFDISLN